MQRNDVITAVSFGFAVGAFFFTTWASVVLIVATLVFAWASAHHASNAALIAQAEKIRSLDADVQQVLGNQSARRMGL